MHVRKTTVTHTTRACWSLDSETAAAWHMKQLIACDSLIRAIIFNSRGTN